MVINTVLFHFKIILYKNKNGLRYNKLTTSTNIIKKYRNKILMLKNANTVFILRRKRTNIMEFIK